MAAAVPAAASDDDVELDHRIVPAALTVRQIPLSAISHTLRLMLKRLEEPSRRIVEVDGVEVLDNVHGLAELLLFSGSVLDFGLAGAATVGAVLDAWDRQDQHANCARLWQLLVSLGRFDLLRDIRNRLVKDAQYYLERRARDQPSSPPLEAPARNERRFDVYVSYCDHCQVDSEKAAEIVQRLRDNGLDVVSAEDRLAGVFPEEEFHSIISRCKRVVVLWSQHYGQQDRLLFELNHARAMDPSAARRRVIPVMLDDTPPPGHLASIVALRFGHPAYFQKLLRSLRDPNGRAA